MSKLTSVDRRVLELLFGMEMGHVLDFTNRTFESFFRDFNILIYSEKYEINGNSKANRLRTFWQVGSDEEVANVLNSLFDYIDAIEPVEAGGKVEERHKRIVERLKLLSSHSQENTGFLHQDFGTLEIQALGLPQDLERIISLRLTEIEKGIKGKAWLSVVILTGSVLEGLLLNAIQKEPSTSNQSKAAPKDKEGKVLSFNLWTLNDLINVSYELNKVSLDVKEHSHSLRNFRNYIHPKQQLKEGFEPDEYTGKIAWQILKAVVAGLSGKRAANV